MEPLDFFEKGTQRSKNFWKPTEELVSTLVENRNNEIKKVQGRGGRAPLSPNNLLAETQGNTWGKISSRVGGGGNQTRTSYQTDL